MDTLNLAGKIVLVVGSGISGIGAVRALVHAGADPILYDANAEQRQEDVAAKLPPGMQVRILLGVLPREVAEMVELVILSPGVPKAFAPEGLRYGERLNWRIASVRAG